MKQSSKGVIAILLSSVFWSFTGVFSRFLLAHGFSAVQAVAVRAILTSIVLGAVLAIKKSELLKIKFRDIWVFLCTGIVSFLLYSICYMIALRENSLSVSVILMNTSVIWIALMSAVFFKEKLNSKSISALTICFFGCCMVCMSSSLYFTPIGILFGLLSGLGYGAYSIFVKLATKRGYSSITTTFYTFLFAAVGALPLCDLPNMISLIANPVNSINSVCIAVLCTLIPFSLYTYGVTKMPAGKAGILATTEPALASIVGIFAFREIPGVIGFTGIAVVIIGIILLEYHKAKNINIRGGN